MGEAASDPLQPKCHQLALAISALVRRDGVIPQDHGIQPKDRTVVAGVAYTSPSQKHFKGGWVYIEQLTLPGKGGAGVADAVAIYSGTAVHDLGHLTREEQKKFLAAIDPYRALTAADYIGHGILPWFSNSSAARPLNYRSCLLLAHSGYLFNTEPDGSAHELLGNYPIPRARPITDEAVNRLSRLVGKVKPPAILPAIPEIAMGGKR